MKRKQRIVFESNQQLWVQTVEFYAKLILPKNQATTKGQLISKCPFGVIVWTKIATKKDWQISAYLTPKEWSNKKNKGTLLH